MDALYDCVPCTQSVPHAKTKPKTEPLILNITPALVTAPSRCAAYDNSKDLNDPIEDRGYSEKERSKITEIISNNGPLKCTYKMKKSPAEYYPIASIATPPQWLD
jgi:hypothetical protein